MRNSLTLILGLTILLSGFAAAQTQNTQTGNDVRVKIDAPPGVQKALMKSEVVRHDFGDVFTTTVSSSRFEQLQRMPGVEASRVQKVHISAPPSACSPWPGCKDGDDDGGSDRVTPAEQTPYGLHQLYNDTAMESTSGGSGVNVAVLDTGVDTDHPDLENRIADCAMWEPPHPSPKKGGFQDGECEDDNGHGTHVAGTVLADAGTDNLGIYGVAPGANLFAYKVLDDSGSGYSDDIAAAIDYASNQGADVVSMSLGADQQNSLIADAIERNRDEVVFVAAAGNDGDDNGQTLNKTTMDYPAANPDVIGVAAINPDYQVTYFSSRGVYDTQFRERDSYVEVSAAGLNVLSTYNDGGYQELSGTSMATPHISGYAARVIASGKASTPEEARSYIQNHADVDITGGAYTLPGYDRSAGIGLPTLD